MTGDSRPQALVLESLVEMRDVFAVAVEQLSRPSLLGDDVLLGCLAPAWMRHLRIDVRPEAIFGGLQVLPETLRPLVREGEALDGLDRFESVFPWHSKPQRRAHRFGDRLAVSACDQESEFVGRFRH